MWSGAETAGAIIVPDVDCNISNEKLAYAQSMIEQSDVPAKELYFLCREYLFGTD